MKERVLVFQLKDVMQHDEDAYLPDFICLDCGMDTAPGYTRGCDMSSLRNVEQYWVHDHVWKETGLDKGDGCLCVGCLEARLGRTLCQDDFDFEDGYWLNVRGPHVSPRLASRRKDKEAPRTLSLPQKK